MRPGLRSAPRPSTRPYNNTTRRSSSLFPRRLSLATVALAVPVPATPAPPSKIQHPLCSPSSSPEPPNFPTRHTHTHTTTSQLSASGHPSTRGPRPSLPRGSPPTLQTRGYGLVTSVPSRPRPFSCTHPRIRSLLSVRTSLSRAFLAVRIPPRSLKQLPQLPLPTSSTRSRPPASRFSPTSSILVLSSDIRSTAAGNRLTLRENRSIPSWRMRLTDFAQHPSEMNASCFAPYRPLHHPSNTPTHRIDSAASAYPILTALTNLSSIPCLSLPLRKKLSKLLVLPWSSLPLTYVSILIYLGAFYPPWFQQIHRFPHHLSPP